MRLNFLFFFLIYLSLQPNLFSQSSIPDSFQMVYAQDFESPQSIRDFEMTDKSAWRILNLPAGNNLELFRMSDYEARVRSPYNIALIKDLVVSDFILEVNLSQTGREYGHRDLCIFFGFNNPTNFYYVHIASIADDHANNIFLVNDEDRVKIAKNTTQGTDWGETNSWHKVRVERVVEAGSIKIYFDDMIDPIMEATDTHFAEGRIGIGSFDDTGRFDNFKIWSPQISKKKMGIFR